MGTYDLFRTIAQSNLTTKERSISQIKNDIIADFYDSPSYQSVTISSVVRDVQIVDESAINKKPNKKRMLALPNETFNIGEVVVWNSENWLLTNLDSDIGVQTKGIIERCNNTLTFYKNHNLYTTPCIIESSVQLYRMSLDETKYISELSDNIVVRIPNNITASLIEINDIFSIGKFNYKLTNMSDVVETGLLVLKLQIVLEQPITHTFTLDITNGTIANIQTGTTLQLNTNVYDNNILISPTPSLTYTSSNTSVATVNSSGLVTGVTSGTATITVKLTSDNTIQDSISVNITAIPQNNYTYSLLSTSIPDTEIVINQTKSYVVTKYNNGVAIAQTFTFSVVGDISAYQLVVVDGNNCTVKALKSSGIITLKAVDDSDISKYVEKNITLKNIF